MIDKARKALTTLLTVPRRPVSVTPSPASVKPHEVSRSIAFYWQQFLKDQPIAFVDVVERCRYYATNSSFLKMFLPLRVSIYNYGFQLRAVNPLDQTKLDEWLKKDAKPPLDYIIDAGTNEQIDLESNTTVGEQISKYVSDVWNEWLLLDNVVTMWIDNRPQPILLDPKRCLYSDTLGIEIMRYNHGLNIMQIDILPDEQRDRFRKYPAVFINTKFGEHYRVLKRSYTGDGFAVPSMLPALKLFGQMESMEMGFHAMAWLMRKATRHHKLGHEITQGPHAGKPTHFWNQKRNDAVQKAWRDVTGIDDYTGNFDHEITYPWPDMKFFDETCWKGSNSRLTTWAGPIAYMLIAKGVTPFLTNLLRAQVLHERGVTVGPFLNTVISKSFKPPVECRVTWGTQIFTEDRLYAEMLKFAHKEGATSPQALIESVGLDADVEGERKKKAAADPAADKKFVPLWDSSHGTAPAIDGTEKPNQKTKKGTGPDSGSKSGTPSGGSHSS